MNIEASNPDAGHRRLLVAVAWVSILLVAELPDILCVALTGAVAAWLLPAKALFLALLLAGCALWPRLRPLRPYALVMAVFLTALNVSEWIRTSSWWVPPTGGAPASFLMFYVRPYVRDLGVALLVIAALWLVKRRRQDFFLTAGRLSAPVEPVRWLGIGPGVTWRSVGLVTALVAAAAVALPTLLSVTPSTAALGRIVPLLPAAALFAAVNAFTEEVYFRATLLSTLPAVIGRNHAQAINIVFFGLAHYLHGSPPGLMGFAMTGFLAWLLGKSMLETRGLFWPWFMHFLPDVVIFASYALAWVAA